MKQVQTPDSRKIKKEGLIWQRRFWEHTIRDTNEYNWYMNYIHWNPVKHGYVESPADWEFTSFHRYVTNGVYPVDWTNESNDNSLNIHREWE